MIFEKIRERLNKAREEAKELQKTTTDAYGYMKMKQGLDCAIDIINQVEAEYNNGWIPCSERLPENISTVLVQVKGIEKPTIGWYGNMDNKWILSERDFADLQEFTVLAWQPLPEPYKKGE